MATTLSNKSQFELFRSGKILIFFKFISTPIRIELKKEIYMMATSEDKVGLLREIIERAIIPHKKKLITAGNIQLEFEVSFFPGLSIIMNPTNAKIKRVRANDLVVKVDPNKIGEKRMVIRA